MVNVTYICDVCGKEMTNYNSIEVHVFPNQHPGVFRVAQLCDDCYNQCEWKDDINSFIAKISPTAQPFTELEVFPELDSLVIEADIPEKEENTTNEEV